MSVAVHVIDAPGASVAVAGHVTVAMRSSATVIGPDSVTTVPDATLDAFRDASEPAPDHATVLEGIDEARADLAALAEAGVDLDDITSRLENDGVKQFAEAYEKMLEAIGRKRQQVGVS